MKEEMGIDMFDPGRDKSEIPQESLGKRKRKRIQQSHGEISSLLSWYEKEAAEKNSYESEMFDAFYDDYHTLNASDQNDLKKGLFALLKNWKYKESQEQRKDFLEKYGDLIPHVVEYQKDKTKTIHIPRKTSLQNFYDEYIKGL